MRRSCASTCCRSMSSARTSPRVSRAAAAAAVVVARGGVVRGTGCMDWIEVLWVVLAPVRPHRHAGFCDPTATLGSPPRCSRGDGGVQLPPQHGADEQGVRVRACVCGAPPHCGPWVTAMKEGWGVGGRVPGLHGPGTSLPLLFPVMPCVIPLPVYCPCTAAVPHLPQRDVQQTGSSGAPCSLGCVRVQANGREAREGKYWRRGHTTFASFLS